VRKREEYVEASLNRKALESCIVAFITGNDPVDMWKSANSGMNAKPPRSTDQNGRPVGTMQPSQIISVENGKTVTVNNPSSQSDYGEFNSMVQHDFSAGTGIPYSRLTGDVTGASYSGERIAGLPYSRQLEVWEQVYLMPILVRRIVRAWCDAAYLKGIVEFADFDQFGHVPCAWVYAPIVQADQLTQLKYDVGRIRSGMATRDDCVIAAGGDPARIDAQRLAEQTAWDESGLVYDCDPRRYAATGNPVLADMSASSTSSTEDQSSES
jgi:capsid protein